jgi:hypothetical protein
VAIAARARHESRSHGRIIELEPTRVKLRRVAGRRCGDGIKNGPEQCDNGAQNQSPATAYGPGICTTTCKFAAYCGDGITQTQFGEQCNGQSNCDATCHLISPH